MSMQNSEKMQLKSAVIYFAADFKFTNYYNMKIINWGNTAQKSCKN